MSYQPQFNKGNEVKADPEWHRIDQLPRRAWTPEQEAAAVAYYTQRLRQPNGTQVLRPIQAVALAEAEACRGLLGAIYVGEGKTLLSALLPVVLGVTRPVLLLPSALKQKTEHEFRELEKQWRIPKYMEIVAYELISKAGRAESLINLRPDLVLADEVHKLRNPKAAVTRRVARLFEHLPATMFCGFSGTLITGALKDTWHLAKWALKANTPLPTVKGIIDNWDQALSDTQFSVSPGILLDWPIAPDLEAAARAAQHVGLGDRTYARLAVQTRMVQTLGFVKSKEGDGPQCSLTIQALRVKPAQITRDHFKRLRTEWQTPDGWDFAEGVTLWRHARELALGFHYVWDPRPPEPWIVARRNWIRAVRQLMQASDDRAKRGTLRTPPIDSEKMARDAVMRGEWNGHLIWIKYTEAERLKFGADGYSIPAEVALHNWLHIAPFTINQKAVWHDHTALYACAKWMQDKRGIVWTEHTVFGQALSELTGVAFYGEKGLDRHGNFLMTHAKAGHPLIASRPPNSTGHNLQGWSTNLITSLASNPTINEQQLGRTHRKGQLADTVEVDVLISCREQYEAMHKAKAKARYIQQTMGQTQRLLMADVLWPSDGDIAVEALSDPCMASTEDIEFDLFE